MRLLNNLKNKDVIYCSECKTKNNNYFKYCVKCGHKLKKISKHDENYRTYCIICGNSLDKHDEFCGHCGYEIFKTIKKVKICPVCGEWVNIERFCQNCGHDNLNNHIDMRGKDKICPNCNTKHPKYLNYCIECGTKLKMK